MDDNIKRKMRIGEASDIGEKLMLVGWAICRLGIIASIIFAYRICADEIEHLHLALWVGIGGSLASWIVSLFIYGFGQLIDDTHEIRKNTEKE